MQIVNFDLEQELWMQEGACVFADPDLFFPVGSSMKALKQAAEAKAICNECDVKIDCLEYAIRTNQDSGCLLYTSPSPRDKRQSRMPSSA